ncbi:MAG: hypothetical protein K2H90_04935 [Oscillospiraceae bacterium]|nr:hypothetical protein [Oscillospiraceae bacterium]
MIYVLQVITGKELTVRKLLEQRDITAYVPRERILIRKGGLWSKMIKLLFPGYVFVDIDYSAEMFHIINPISGVIRFLGLPTPLPEREADLILWLSNGGEIIEPSPLTVDGDNITCGGFLEGHEDDIKYLNARQKKAAVEVRFGGKVHRANIGIEIQNGK